MQAKQKSDSRNIYWHTSMEEGNNILVAYICQYKVPLFQNLKKKTVGQQNRNRQKKLQTLKVSKSLSVTTDSNTASVRSRRCKLFKGDKKARRLFFFCLMLHTKHDVMNQVTLLICSTTDSISMLVDYQQSNK